MTDHSLRCLGQSNPPINPSSKITTKHSIRIIIIRTKITLIDLIRLTNKTDKIVF